MLIIHRSIHPRAATSRTRATPCRPARPTHRASIFTRSSATSRLTTTPAPTPSCPHPRRCPSPSCPPPLPRLATGGKKKKKERNLCYFIVINFGVCDQDVGVPGVPGAERMQACLLRPDQAPRHGAPRRRAQAQGFFFKKNNKKKKSQLSNRWRSKKKSPFLPALNFSSVLFFFLVVVQGVYAWLAALQETMR